MLTTKRSVPLLSRVSIIAIGLAASPIAVDIHPMGVGDNAAFAQGGHGGGGGGAGGGGGGPGGGGGMGGQGPRSGDQDAGQGMGMQPGPMSQSGEGPMSQGGMTQQMQHQTMNRETIRSVQRRLNQLGYRAGPEDGIMGPRTRGAISAYQRKMGMQPDGKLTPDLVNHLMAESRGK